MSGISSDKREVLALLQGILTTYAVDIVLPLPDGVLSFTYRLVMVLVSDCLTKYHRGRISSEYLEHLQMNIRTLVQQAEERSQSGDLAFFKQLAQKFLDVLEYIARSLKHLETPDGDSKKGQQRNIADPNTSEPGLKTDLIEETTEPATADGGIPEIPEIPESASAVIRSLNPMRKPSKSDYTQIKEISSGSYGAVHLVRHKDTNKVFAMKKQARSELDHPFYLEMAYLERDIAIFSDCPFVVSTFCSFPTKHHLCMVMDFEAGGDCERLIKSYGPFPLALARIYIAETVLAVEYLHSYGVVHRDLKPLNLILSSTGHIKVTDFGLSRLGLMRPTSDIYKAPTKDITREFHDDGITGTYQYVAPEVILQEGYGRPIDWWAIGIILYKFLTGQVPFNGRCKKDIFKSIIKDDITSKIQNSTDYPDAQDFMTQLLRKDPTHRLGTGGANKIKSHPFLSGLNFENLQNQYILYRPTLESEEDTRYFDTGFWRPKHMDSDEGDTSEVSDWPESLNYVSSSERLSKVYATNTRMMSNEDHEPSPDCSLETSTKHSDVQKESSPTRNDGDNQCFTTENKTPSPILSVEMKNKSVLNLGEEQDPEIVPETEPIRVETKNTSAIKLGEDQDPEIVAETEPSRVETKNISALKLGEQDPEIVAETEPSRVETKNTSALKLGEDQDPEIVAETEPSRVETKNKSVLNLGEEQDPEIVPETEPSRVETKNASALKLAEDQDPERVAETEPSRVETKNTSAIKLGEDQDPEIVPETEPCRVETKNKSVLNLGEEQNPEIVAETEASRVETKNTSAIKLGEDQDPEIVPETEPCRVETKNISALKLGEQDPEIVAETEPSRVETKNTSALKLGEDQDPEIVAETEPSRVETKNISALKLGEQDPEIVAEAEPSRVEKKNKSAIKLVEEQNAKIKEEREPRRRSIFRRIISSCRRGLSRAARSIRKRCIFPICC
ncbi:microtubule-associated serine/threonine-protein kinase 4-like isoform X9 [Ranitomeya variabilis]|uniref:microtubule-associated serine/threonine-protein kinase 4-like isoform X9 n=1 Tax=Ranitomeya variabilis TaxID=490064 RepID=UPI004056C446